MGAARRWGVELDFRDYVPEPGDMVQIRTYYERDHTDDEGQVWLIKKLTTNEAERVGWRELEGAGYSVWLIAYVGPGAWSLATEAVPLTPLQDGRTTFHYVWDNGNDTGRSPNDYYSRQDAEDAARDWQHELCAATCDRDDHDYASGHEDDSCPIYTWEIVEEEGGEDRIGRSSYSYGRLVGLTYTIGTNKPADPRLADLALELFTDAWHRRSLLSSVSDARRSRRVTWGHVLDTARRRGLLDKKANPGGDEDLRALERKAAAGDDLAFERLEHHVARTGDGDMRRKLAALRKKLGKRSAHDVIVKRYLPMLEEFAAAAIGHPARAEDKRDMAKRALSVAVWALQTNEEVQDGSTGFALSTGNFPGLQGTVWRDRVTVITTAVRSGPSQGLPPHARLRMPAVAWVELCRHLKFEPQTYEAVAAEGVMVFDSVEEVFDTWGLQPRIRLRADEDMSSVTFERADDGRPVITVESEEGSVHWTVIALDVVGNRRDGYEINDRRRAGVLSAEGDLSAQELLDALIEDDYLDERCVLE